MLSPTISGWEAIEYNLGLIGAMCYTKYSMEGIAEGNFLSKSAYVVVSFINSFIWGLPFLLKMCLKLDFSASSWVYFYKNS